MNRTARILAPRPDHGPAPASSGPMPECRERAVRNGRKTLLQNIGWSIVQYDCLDSTINEAERLILGQNGRGVHKTAIVADEQTQGKGRHDHAWSSPAMAGLWCSLVVTPAVPPEALAQVTLVTAVAVAEAVAEVAGVRLSIKWPNDLLHEGKKVCGILTESVPVAGNPEDGRDLTPVIIGFGINLNQRQEDFTPELRECATSLAQILGTAGRQTVQRDALLESVLVKFHTRYEEWAHAGFEPARRAWLAHSCTMNRWLTWQERNETLRGKAVDLEADGSLKVCMKDGTIHRLNAGEIRFLRPALAKGDRDE